MNLGRMIAPPPHTKVIFLQEGASSKHPWIPVKRFSKYGDQLRKALQKRHCYLCRNTFDHLALISTNDWENWKIKKNLLEVKFAFRDSPNPIFYQILFFATLFVFPAYDDMHFDVTLDYYDKNGNKATLNERKGPVARIWLGWVFLPWGPFASDEDAEKINLLLLTVDSLMP